MTADIYLDHEILNIEEIDKRLPGLPPATGNFFTPLGLYYAIILPTTRLQREGYPKIYWELELPENGHILKFKDNIYKAEILSHVKKKFLTLGVKINSVADMEKALKQLHFSVIDIDIILTEKNYRIINFLGYTDGETFENTPPESAYYPSSYRYKKTRYK